MFRDAFPAQTRLCVLAHRSDFAVLVRAALRDRGIGIDVARTHVDDARSGVPAHDPSRQPGIHRPGHGRVARRAELEPREKQYIRRLGQAGQVFFVEQVRPDGFDAGFFEIGADPCVAEPGDADHAPRAGPYEKFRQGRPHLPAGAQNHHVAFQFRHGPDDGRRRGRHPFDQHLLARDQIRHWPPRRVAPQSKRPARST